MKAARGFTHGDGAKVHRFLTGDEVPDKIVKELGDAADTLILEKAAMANPDVLSREQLLELAGLSTDEIPEAGTDPEFNEDNFREGMEEFTTKGDLIEWAEATLGIEGLEKSWTRIELEDAIVGAFTADDADDEDE